MQRGDTQALLRVLSADVELVALEVSNFNEAQPRGAEGQCRALFTESRREQLLGSTSTLGLCTSSMSGTAHAEFH